MIAATGCTVDGIEHLFGDPVVCSMSKHDFLLIAGGTGIGAPRADIPQVLGDYRQLPCSVLFLDAPGDDFDMYREYPMRPWNGGLAQWFCRGVMRLCRGQVFSLFGKSVLTVGGGTTVGRNDTGKYYDWWPEQDITDADVSESLRNAGSGYVDAVISSIAPIAYDGKSTISTDSLVLISESVRYGTWYCSGAIPSDTEIRNLVGLGKQVVRI